MQDTQAVNNPAGQTPINAPIPDSTPQLVTGGTPGNEVPLGSGPTTGDTVDASPGQSTDATTPPVVEGAQIPAETQTIKLNDGSEISIDEARDGYLRQADYTRKTQELAEQRRQVAEQQRQNEVWHNYYQQLNTQTQGQSQVEVKAEGLSPVVFREEDYATDTERKLALELNNTREMVSQMDHRLTGYDERFATTERQRADDHVAREMDQWTAQYNVTEAEILTLHDETGVSNVRVLAELLFQRKQVQAQQGVTSAQQVTTAAQNAQVVTQEPRAAPQSTEIAIDYGVPMSKRVQQLRAKYPNL